MHSSKLRPGRLAAALAAIALTALPAAAQVTISAEFDSATASIMQGNLTGGPNADCYDGSGPVDYPAPFTYRNGDPGADYLYQSYDLYNNGPTRCVEVALWWKGQNCDMRIGLALYLGSFDPSDPTQNLIGHSYVVAHDFFDVGNPLRHNEYDYTPGYYHDQLQKFHFDYKNIRVQVPALAKVVAVLDSLEQPGSTKTCPIDTATGSVYLQSDRLSKKPLAVSVSDTSNYEFNPPSVGKLTFYVSLSAQFAAPFSVEYSTSPGTAGVGTDYQTTAGTLSFAPGETLKLVEVPIVADTANEAPPSSESMTLTLANPSPIVAISDATATGTIFDDDDPNASCHVTTFPAGPLPAGKVGEPYGPLDFAASGSDTIDFEWSLDSGSLPPGINLTQTAGSPVQGVIAGVPEQAGDFSFTVHLLCHLTDNGLEDVYVPYSIHVEPEQPPVLISLEDIDVLEGNAGITAALPYIKLSAPLDHDLLLEVVTYDSSATVANTDYNAVAPGQQILIPKDTTVEPIPLEIVGDLDPEPDELFLVQLLTPLEKNEVANATIGVLNDDALAVDVPTLRPIVLALFALALAGLGAMFLHRPR